MKRDKRFWYLAVMVSLAVHAPFCTQAYVAARHGGMMLNALFMFLFFPHAMLMFFLPPAYPIDLSGGVSVDWVGFAGKLLVAYPASLLYGWLLTGFWYFLRRRAT